MFNRSRVVFIEEDLTFEEIVSACAKRLEQEGFIADEKQYTQAVLKRESVYPTHIDNGVYFPHPLINDALKGGICVGVVHGNSVEAQQEIHLVFVSCHEEQINPEMIHIYNLINKVAASPQLVSVLLSLPDEGELIDYLERVIQIM